jgi:SAM-dependent methyltransferase
VGTSREESAREAASLFGAAHWFTDAAELAAHRDVDLVVITVKVPFHYELAEAALRAGKHVLVEWPLARTTEEAQRLTKLASQAGVRHAVPDFPAAVHVHELLDAIRSAGLPPDGRGSATGPPSLFGMTHVHDQHQHGHGHGHGAGSDGMTDLLELDAEVLHGYWTSALDWVRAVTDGTAADVTAPGTGAPARILDLGAGTGTGALGLARRFPAAEVIAVDVSADSLGRLRDKAARGGLSARVKAVEADLDAGWPDLGPLDLTWASMSLHHLGEPARALRDVLAATRPGGQIAVAEFARPLRFLPDDLGFGQPGFEERALDVLGRAHAQTMPTLGSAWVPRLAGTGWQVIGERDFPVDLAASAHPKAAEYAYGWFGRQAHVLTDALDAGDQATLDALLDRDGPHSLSRLPGLRIRGFRTVIMARRA